MKTLKSILTVYMLISVAVIGVLSLSENSLDFQQILTIGIGWPLMLLFLVIIVLSSVNN